MGESGRDQQQRGTGGHCRDLLTQVTPSAPLIAAVLALHTHRLARVLLGTQGGRRSQRIDVEWTELRGNGKAEAEVWPSEQGAHHDRLRAELFKHVVPSFTPPSPRRGCAAGIQGSLDLEEETEDSWDPADCVSVRPLKEEGGVQQGCSRSWHLPASLQLSQASVFSILPGQRTRGKRQQPSGTHG